MSKPFYITTTLPYVNADPHIGFALEIVQADIIARYKKIHRGAEVFFNTGVDEHGTKIHRKAVEEGKDTQKYVDEYAEKFKNLKGVLGLFPEINFIRTTDSGHKEAAQEFWKKCEQAGDIYKKNYKIKYCVGCELEKTDSELENGKCPIHPNLELEIIDEENYFFKLSKYQEKLVKFYEQNPEFVLPAFRLNEIKSLIKSKGLEDFSISRLKSKMPWGVPVPGDDKQVVYVWFDALVNYISAIGWPTDMKKFEKWWPVVQFAGKDQVRQQAVMWQAMLMSAKLPASKQIVIHGFITSGGQKMSKSLGNVIDPLVIVKEYGTDALRYFLARHVHPFEDTDVTLDLFKHAYNDNLANGLGNLVSRIMKMAEANLERPVEIPEREDMSAYFAYLEKFETQKACEFIWQQIAVLDQKIQETQPFKLVKTDKSAGVKIIQELAVGLYSIARMLNPIMPETSATIKALIKSNKMPEKPLFQRKD